MASSDLTTEAQLVYRRLGFNKLFVLSAPSRVSLQEQAVVFFEAVAQHFRSRDGWLIDDRTEGGNARGFSRLMERRDQGECAWDKVAPWKPAPGQGWAGESAITYRTPYNILARLGYPCWALRGHLYSLDLFNPTNELLLPYSDGEHRFWAVIPFPGRFKMLQRTWPDLLQSAASALDVEYGFGGQIVGPAIIAYNCPGDFRPLREGVRLSDMAYQHMILRAEDLPRDWDRSLRQEFVVAGKAFKLPICEPFANGSHVFLSVVDDYMGENIHLGRAVAAILGRPYANHELMRQAV